MKFAELLYLLLREFLQVFKKEIFYILGKIGHRCKCEDGSKHCILDERFYCRKTLTVLSGDEDLQNLERQFRNERRRRRRHLKRLIKTWIKDEISML